MERSNPQNNSAGMIDISHKEVTKRTAVASARITLSPSAFKKLIKEGSPKGNVFETARVAGIMAAKSTPNIVPLCHPLQLSKVQLRFDIDVKKYSITTTVEVVCLGQTGVEMEALTAVTAASLTIYDMMKWADQTMVISDVKLLKKIGGKSGNFERTNA